MKDKTIDLLQPDELASVKERKTILFRLGTIFLVVFYCLIVIILFAFGLVAMRESQVVAKKIVLEEDKLNSLQEVESLQLFLKQRLSSLVGIVETKDLKPKYWLSYLDSLVPEGVVLEKTNWEVAGEVRLSGIAANAVILADFLDRLKEETDAKKIASSTLISATRQTAGLYAFSLEILVQQE